MQACLLKSFREATLFWPKDRLVPAAWGWPWPQHCPAGRARCGASAPVLWVTDMLFWHCCLVVLFNFCLYNHIIFCEKLKKFYSKRSIEISYLWGKRCVCCFLCLYAYANLIITTKAYCGERGGVCGRAVLSSYRQGSAGTWEATAAALCRCAAESTKPCAALPSVWGCAPWPMAAAHPAWEWVWVCRVLAAGTAGTAPGFADRAPGQAKVTPSWWKTVNDQLLLVFLQFARYRSLTLPRDRAPKSCPLVLSRCQLLAKEDVVCWFKCPCCHLLYTLLWWEECEGRTMRG